MNTIDLASLPKVPGSSAPTVLFQDSGHAVYWLGLNEETAFRCNVYLVVDGDQALLIDPGDRRSFETVKSRVAQVLPPEKVTGMVLCHQDPDVAASMVDWLAVNPDMGVYTSMRANVLLPYFGVQKYRFVDVVLNKTLRLPSGATLSFIEAPFLHFAGAITTHDSASGFLFSGDIWAAVGSDWSLVVDNFISHSVKMDMFHIDYMASNLAARGFVRRLEPVQISAILPQHGSIIDGRFVDDAIDYLSELECGTDVLYPDL